MSTKIYNAYVTKRHFRDLHKALRAFQVAACAENRDFRARSTPEKGRAGLETLLRKAMDPHSWLSRAFSVVVWGFPTRKYAQAFKICGQAPGGSNSPSTVEFLRAVDARDYHYQDQVSYDPDDPAEEIHAAGAPERKRMWEKMMGPSYVPGLTGLTFEIVSMEDDLTEIIRAAMKDRGHVENENTEWIYRHYASSLLGGSGTVEYVADKIINVPTPLTQ